jgi:hypothetical protein
MHVAYVRLRAEPGPFRVLQPDPARQVFLVVAQDGGLAGVELHEPLKGAAGPEVLLAALRHVPAGASYDLPAVIVLAVVLEDVSAGLARGRAPTA